MKIDLGERFGFAGSVQQTISIVNDTIDFVLTLSTDAERMPGQVGWHPWFARPCRIETDFAQMYVRDSDGIPSGEVVSPPAGPYDDCFTGARKPPKIIFDESITVQIDSDCSHWVVYDQPEHAICVEPQSGPPDGFNLAPFIITRDKPLSRFMRLTITK
jgi:aldose 1-epimerase